ncbi:S8 family serine peptidase [Streptomyces sp. NPDC046909]|uniref:S8 family serine peptidase n=1 Tax=Streptomyces sp. NPDC046909 TaxID=3155617 RepID=UPI0033D4CC2F
MTDFAKLDVGLLMVLRAYESESGTPGGATSQGISVRITHTGDLAAIEAAGFDLGEEGDGHAYGIVLFQDLPRLTQLDQVEWISSGAPRGIDLDTAVKDIGVRASSAALADGLWHAVTATGAFTGGADATGAGVIVAVIDTGIDYTHPMFMKRLVPTKQTRILRIWDQGLTPAAATDCPALSLLASTQRYGVEYDDTEIEASLNGGPPLRHRDCDGHGTHVAGIAAGGNQFVAGADAAVMGVAPEADIIAVKMLDTPFPIHYFTGPPGVQVGPDDQFRDAILYCLRTARALGKSIVINMSFGSPLEPGDGLDADAVWVDERLDPAHAADPTHFPTGAIVVKSSGNHGDDSRRAVARIEVPASGEVTVPLLLTDTRGALQTKYTNCLPGLFKPPIGFRFWYRRANPFTAVSFAVRLPERAAFTGAMSVGGFLDEHYGIRVGPPRLLVNLAPAANAHHVVALHGGEPTVGHPDGGSLRRHSFDLNVFPRTSGGTISYLTGAYEVKITAPAGTELFLMCRRQSWALGKSVSFKVADTMTNGLPLDAAIDVTSEFSTVDTFGRHVLTVAAYDDKDGDTTHADYRAIASFSSRGPLRDFSDPAAPLAVIAEKPDIAAPGVKIDSAKSRDSDPDAFHLPDWHDGNRFEKLGGTSMATPMITGVVALMLDKKPDLNTATARPLLAGAARAAVRPSVPPASTRAYGAGLADGKTTHDNVT